MSNSDGHIRLDDDHDFMQLRKAINQESPEVKKFEEDEDDEDDELAKRFGISGGAFEPLNMEKIIMVNNSNTLRFDFNGGFDDDEE